MCYYYCDVIMCERTAKRLCCMCILFSTEILGIGNMNSQFMVFLYVLYVFLYRPKVCVPLTITPICACCSCPFHIYCYTKLHSYLIWGGFPLAVGACRGYVDLFSFTHSPGALVRSGADVWMSRTLQFIPQARISVVD